MADIKVAIEDAQPINVSLGEAVNVYEGWTGDYNELINKPDLTLKADKTYVDSQDTALQAAINTKQPTGDYATNSSLTAHTSNTANPHSVTKSQVGLSDVPNLDTTAAVANQHTHANKAVLDATTASFTTADEMKLDGIATGAQVNTVTSVNTRTGAVTGLAEASDLTAHTGNTSNPHSVTKAQVGLGNVDNTSDSAKPVSTAQQTALDGKQPTGDYATNNGLITGLANQRGAVFEDYSSLSGFSVFSAAGSIASNTDYVKHGTSSLQITSESDTCSIDKDINTTIDGNGNMKIWVYIPDITGIEYLNVYFSSTTNYSKFFNRPFAATSLHDGWNCLSYTTTDWSNTGSESWTNVFRKMRVRIDNIEGTTPVVIMDSIITGQTSRPKVLITFDDGKDSSYTKGYSYMNSLGLVGTNYMIKELVGANTFMTLAQAQEMYDNGWDLGVHGEVDLQTLTLLQQKDDILLNQSFLLDNGFERAALHYAYPFGSYNDDALTALGDLGFQTARTTKDRSQVNTLDEQYLLARYCVYPSTSVAEFKQRLDSAIAGGDAILFNYHIIVDSNATEGTMVLTADFQQMMDYVKQKVDEGVVDCETISQWYQGVKKLEPLNLPESLDFKAKANLMHTHPIADITATGTASSTTYLRGDGSWAVPSTSFLTGAAKITVGTSTPSSPTTGDLWVDTN